MIIIMFETAKFAENEFKLTKLHNLKGLIVKYNKGEHKLIGHYEFPYSIIEP